MSKHVNYAKSNPNFAMIFSHKIFAVLSFVKRIRPCFLTHSLLKQFFNIFVCDNPKTGTVCIKLIKIKFYVQVQEI